MFKPAYILEPRRYLLMSGDDLGFHNWCQGCYFHVKGSRNAAQELGIVNDNPPQESVIQTGM